MRKEKEEIMTNVLTDIKDFIETEEVKIDHDTMKLDMICNFFILKAIANKSKDKIRKYTERNKNVRNGKTVLAGTRITTKELILIISENSKEKNTFKYISEQYPSIDCEEKILYGALYEISRKNSLLFILDVLLSKK